jgi:hypothetical protein
MLKSTQFIRQCCLGCNLICIVYFPQVLFLRPDNTDVMYMASNFPWHIPWSPEVRQCKHNYRPILNTNYRDQLYFWKCSFGISVRVNAFVVTYIYRSWALQSIAHYPFYGFVKFSKRAFHRFLIILKLTLHHCSRECLDIDQPRACRKRPKTFVRNVILYSSETS